MMSKFHKFVTMVVVASVISLSSIGNSSAQYYYYGDEGAGLVVLSSTTTTTGVVVGGIVLTVLLVTGVAEMETYMRNNAVALQEDITLGGGQTTQDLAAAFQVSEENLALFARMLQDNRDQLLPLTDPNVLDAERADKFTQVILDSMLADPYLATELIIELSAS